MSPKTYHSSCFWLFVVILIWLPLAFGSNQPMFAAVGETAILLLFLVALLLVNMQKISIPESFRAARLPLGLLLVFLLVQCALHFVLHSQPLVDGHATRAQLLQTVCLIQIFVLVLVLVDSESRLKALAVALMLAGTFQAVYGTLMTVTDTNYIWNHKKEAYIGVATGTFVNRNHLAGYLEMTLALGLGLMIATMTGQKSRTWRQFFRQWTATLLGEKARIRACLVLMVIGLILTRSRMGNTAFFVGMGIAGIIGLFVFRRSQSGVAALFVSILVIDIFLLGTFFGLEELQERLQQTSVDAENRRLISMLSLGLLYEAPWFGHGLGSFPFIFPSVRTGEISRFVRETHNDLLQFPIEVGLLGFGLLVLVFLLSFFTALRVQVRRRNRLFRAMGFSCTMAMISIALHSATDFNLQVFANAATFMVILAIPWVAYSLPGRTNRSSRSRLKTGTDSL